MVFDFRCCFWVFLFWNFVEENKLVVLLSKHTCLLPSVVQHLLKYIPISIISFSFNYLCVFGSCANWHAKMFRLFWRVFPAWWSIGMWKFLVVFVVLMFVCFWFIDCITLLFMVKFDLFWFFLLFFFFFFFCCYKMNRVRW